MFRMTRECFKQLTQKIFGFVGEKSFKSEAYINAFLIPNDSTYCTHCLTSGGYICGEVNLVIIFCLLAGGDTLDLAVIFDVSSN